jgi:long-chain acyl-CoA synthetase
MDLPDRPWRNLYRGAPFTIDAPAETALDMFRATLRRAPDAPLAYYFERAITAAEVDALSNALAVALQRRGASPGDRIAMYLQNIPQVLVAVVAAWKCGAVIVPCNPMLRERELVKILSDSGTRFLVCQEDLYQDVAATALPSTAVEHAITTSALDFLDPTAPVPRALAAMTRARHPEVPDLVQLAAAHAGQVPEAVDLTADDVAFMVYTSGTTGEPKAAMNTHGNVVFATAVYERWIGLTSQDPILGLAPLFHVTGLIGHVALAMLTGAPLVLFYRFDPQEACRLTARHRPTFTVSSVTAFIALLNSEAMAAHDISSLTKVYTGGAPTPPSVLDDWHRRTGTRIHPMYGLTEATSPTHMTPHGVVPPVDPRTGAVSIGIPVFNTTVRVAADAGHDAAAREVGELIIAGPQIIPGYWQKPEETAKSLTGGELRTGDVGFFDEDGWFYLVDRAKDMIVASGFKVWPREVEEVLYLHPAVREAAVVGVPDAYRGETIKAVVSLKPGHETTPDDIKAFVRERMAAYKYPRLVEIIDELPKTTSGKIMRRLLQASSPAVVTRHATEADLVDVSYPQLRAALRARAVLEVGATWLRLSRGPVPRSTSEKLYERLQQMVAQLTHGCRFVDREAFLAANDAFHVAIVSLAENEHLIEGFRRLRLHEIFSVATKDVKGAPENVVSLHENLTDAIAANDAFGAVKAILSWGEASRATMHYLMGQEDLPRGADDLGSTGIVEDLSIGQAREQGSLTGDVDALAAALDARAALEIGITQSMGPSLTKESDREALVARLLAFTPLVRGASARHVSRYIRADDAFHRIFFSLLRNRPLFEIYNAMDVPELMRRVLEVAPASIRVIFDDHRSLVDALRGGDANATAAAITGHANRVRAALVAFVNEERSNLEKTQAIGGA